MSAVAAANAHQPKGERRTLIAHRVCNATGRQGPEVVFNEQTGVSTMVTRSFGDSLGSDAITDEPEVRVRVCVGRATQAR